MGTYKNPIFSAASINADLISSRLESKSFKETFGISSVVVEGLIVIVFVIECELDKKKSRVWRCKSMCEVLSNMRW